MSKHNKKLLLAASIAAVNMTMFTSPALAQANENAVLEEVLVTARKRTESLQDVPIAVTAFDGASIERAQLNTVADLEKFVPNVDFADNPFAGQALGATIRGVGFTDFEKSFEPAVGFSIDGVFLASNTGAAIDSFDLAQVEVLRGPQGTLFGRNTVGGVINVTRTRPTGEAGLKIGANLANNAGRELNMILNTEKIADVLSVKLHALKKQDETFSTDIITGAPEDQTDITSYGAAFLIEANEDFEALISLDVFDDDSQGVPIFSTSQDSDLFCFLPFVLLLDPDTGQFDPNTPFSFGNINANCQSDSFDVAEASGFEVHTRGIPFITHLSGSSGTVNIEYDVSDSLRLTSITAYRQTDEQLFSEGLGARNLEANFGFGVLSAPSLVSNRVQQAEQFSQEFRLTGDSGDRLTFVAGAFYMNSKYRLTGGDLSSVTFFGGFGTGAAFGGVSADEVTEQETNAFAIFADGTYELTDRLSLSGGLRVSWEEKEFSKQFILAPDPAVNGSSFAGTESWTNPTGRLIAQYELSDTSMVYGGWSRGVRSGGFNGRAAAPDRVGPYDEETVDSFEAGLRAEFFNNKLRVNPTIFLAQYDDKQEENAVGVGTTGVVETTVQNASSVDISGLELEVLAQVTPSLALRGALGLLDAEFDEFLVPDPANPGSFIDVADSRNLRSGPDSNITLGATYVRSVMDGNGQVTFNAAYNWADEIVTSAASDPLGLGRDRVDGVEGFDFSLGFQTLNSTGPNFSVTAFINDAFDKDAGRNAVGVVVPGILAFGAGQPTQVFGVDFAVEF